MINKQHNDNAHWVLPATWPSLSDPFTYMMSLEGDVFREVAHRKTLRFMQGGEAYFAKLHSGVGWKEIIKNLLQGRLPVLGATQEWRAIQRLTQLGIPTTPFIGYGRRGLNPAKQQSFIITKALTETISLEDFCRDWQNQPPPLSLKRALIANVATIARQLHTHGINHRDFYICHFLLDKTRGMQAPYLYLIDLHRAQIRSRTPLRWIIKDIAGLYFSAMDLGLTRRDLYAFIKHYHPSLRLSLLQHQHFWSRVEKRARALYRKTFFIQKQTFDRKIICDMRYHTPAMQQLLNNPDSALQHALLKHDATTTVGLIKLDDRQLVVKRYNIKGFWHAFKRAISKSRASICWHYAQQLHSADISTPKPIAMLEKRYGIFRSTAYYMTEYIHAPHAADYFSKATTLSDDHLKVAQKIARLFTQLTRKKLTHGDMKATNILIADGNPVLIDLDSMQQHRAGFHFARKKQHDLARFMKNWQHFPEIKQLFLRILGEK